jgi:hypothetical protein
MMSDSMTVGATMESLMVLETHSPLRILELTLTSLASLTATPTSDSPSTSG